MQYDDAIEKISRMQLKIRTCLETSKYPRGFALQIELSLTSCFRQGFLHVLHQKETIQQARDMATSRPSRRYQ